MINATASWPVGIAAWAIARPAASDIARFFGFTADSRTPIPNDFPAVNESIAPIHFGSFGASPSRGRPRHWRAAATSSNSPSSSLMMLTVCVGPLPDE